MRLLSARILTALLVTLAVFTALPPRPAAAQPGPTGEFNGWLMPMLLPSEVDVVLHADPNLTVPAGAILTYHVVMTNRGDGDSPQNSLTFPLDATKVQLLDVTTTRPEFWVNSVSAGQFTMETGRLISNDVVTATVRLRTLPTLAAGTEISQVVTFSASENAASAPTHSNRTLVTIGATAQNRTIMPLDVVTWLAPVGRQLHFSSPFFQPGEPVTFWYSDTTPDDTFVDTIGAGPDGTVMLNFDSGTLRPGYYTMVARGEHSGIMARGTFELQANLGTVDIVIMPDGTVTWRDSALGSGNPSATLIWNRTVDLNLIVVDPNGGQISVSGSTSPQARIDSSSSCTGITLGKPENIYWPAGSAPKGTYRVYVDYVDGCTEDEDTPYTVYLHVDGVGRTYGGMIGPDDENQLVTTFELR